MNNDSGEESLDIARRWCSSQGSGWSVVDEAGRGGTAPVYGLTSPEGPRALKVYDSTYSEGDRGEIEERRVEQQKSLGRHGHPGIVEVYDGGRFEDRIFLLMTAHQGQSLKNVYQMFLARK